MNVLTCVLLTMLVTLHQDPPTRTKAMDDGLFALDADGAAVDGQVVKGNSPPKKVRIAILPDRSTGKPWGIPYLETAVEDLKRLNPDAVFCVGDLIQGYTSDPKQWDREADEYIEIVSRLKSDFYPTAGNHDVISGRRDPSDRTFIDRYHTRFGPVHYAVEIDEATIIILFSDEMLDDRNVQFSETQRTWLQGILEDAHARGGPIAILMHRPLWRYSQVDWDNRVHPLLVKHGVDLVIAGHFHALHKEPDRDGIEYHLLGVCGGSIDQHPLTGQFHHISMVELGPGDTATVMHMPVGVTLPDNFVSRTDQDRAYSLKRSYNNASISGSLNDPLNGPVDSTVELTLQNPLSIPITAQIEPARSISHWDVPGLPFTAATPADIENDSTTHFDTPFTLDPVEDVSLQPGEKKTIPLTFTALQTEQPPGPPQILITTTFTDEKSRSVPVFLHRRIPITRSVRNDLPETEYPISAWKHSVYEEPEAESILRIDFTGPTANLQLRLEDDQLCGWAEDVSESAQIARRMNPSADLIRILVAGSFSGGQKEFLITPTSNDGTILEIDKNGSLDSKSQGAWMTLDEGAGFKILEITLPNLDPREITAIQVEIADNDLTFHTQWRRLAPSGKMLQIIGGAP